MEKIKTNKLDILASAYGFTVEKFTDCYEVTSDNAPLMATIDEWGNIEYYLTDVKNMVYDTVNIEIDKLLELKALCEELVK